MGEKVYKPIVKDGDHLIRSKDNPDRVRGLTRDENTRELFSLTGGGVRLNGDYVPVQASKIDEALKAIPMPES